MPKIKKANYFQAQIKELQEDKESGVIKIRGFASTPSEDRYGDIVEPNAFKKALKKYMQNPQILLMHDPYETIGLATSAQITEKGLMIEAELSPDGSEKIDVALTRVKQGKLRTLSIGYIPLKTKFVHKDTGEEITQEDYYDLPYKQWKEYKRVITELDLVENSVVSTPANADAIFTVQKSLTKYFDALESERKELYQLNNNDMPKTDIQKKNTDEELENVNEEVETTDDTVEDTAEDKTEETTEEVVDETVEEVEEKEEEGDDTDDKTDNSDDSEDDDVEKSDENSDTEDKADDETDDGDNSDDDEADDEEEEKEVEDADEKTEDDETDAEVDEDGAKTFIKNLSNIILSDKSEDKIDLKKLVDIKDAKALTSLCEKLLALSVSQQKQISDLTATLDVTPNKKAVMTLRQYPHTENNVAKKEVEAKKEASKNAIKSIFARQGFNLKD